MKRDMMETITNICSTFCGQADNIMYALILLVIIDYITGICAAIHAKSLASSVGATGIAKKVAIFLVISVSHIVDQYLINQENVLRTVTIMFYISNEGLSIIENIGRMGVPLPKEITDFLRHLKDFKDAYKKDL
ncbi:phage holin family protein [Flintibacter muris]|uniref:phage holin family protein n=1 Tax=Flintibacter muris TaxID=2941327 RepID=UPI00203E2500|nr:phage holin family protein [Flintibacter muris]